VSTSDPVAQTEADAQRAAERDIVSTLFDLGRQLT
jgi:hypothetical protein